MARRYEPDEIATQLTNMVKGNATRGEVVHWYNRLTEEEKSDVLIYLTQRTQLTAVVLNDLGEKIRQISAELFAAMIIISEAFANRD